MNVGTAARAAPVTLAGGLGRYFSAEQLARLSGAHVGIIGAGGLGSNVAMMLARSGVRRMTLVDFDRVEASNLNRQAYFPRDVGLSKVRALARHLQNLEPAMELRLHRKKVTKQNAASLLLGCNAVVEAVDGAETKAMLYAVFAPAACFYVTASGLGGLGGEEEQPMRVRRLGAGTVCVGDFTRQVDKANPPFAPRVTQAAALQADAVLRHILTAKGEEHEEQTA